MDPRCEEVRALAPELALGIVEGEERGRALEHLADCPECRRRVQELAGVADQLLLLAPHREAPAGFESRVLGRVLPSPRPRRRRRRLALVLAPVAAALAAVAITLAIVSDDLRLADQYRGTLDEANGRDFEAHHLYAKETPAGTVFTYQGDPSWLLINVDQAHRAEMRAAELVTDDGRLLHLSWFHLDPLGSSGGSIPVDPHHITALRLRPTPGGEPLVARFSS
jgi:hypothetical protein